MVTSDIRAVSLTRLYLFPRIATLGNHTGHLNRWAFELVEMVDAHQNLLDEAVRGNTRAMSELLARCGPDVRRRLRGRIAPQYRSALDEDDVLQVTYLEAFLRIRSFEPNGMPSFVAWLTKIAHNNLRDAIKQLNRKKEPPPDRQVTADNITDSHTDLLTKLQNPGTTPSGQIMRAENKTLLDAAIDQLPQDYAHVVRLYDLERQSVADVADAMNRSVGAVYMLRSRAHGCLKELLGPKSNFYGRSV